MNLLRTAAIFISILFFKTISSPLTAQQPAFGQPGPHAIIHRTIHTPAHPSSPIITQPSIPGAQQPAFGEPILPGYHATPARINDLVHTRLDLRFDYKRCHVSGREWLTLHPHFYQTDSLRLDAKGMDIKKVALLKDGKYQPLPYTYDSMTLSIRLDRYYQMKEQYHIFIDYTARPRETTGIAPNEQGLYFVNPDGSQPDKPTQIWTLGQPENSSVWFPTIDKPNQKTTGEITMTVPAKYITLSNGRLTTKIYNADGTRTDTWKMDLPHAPYLFMIAVGDFKIYKDHWHGKEVSYYLEPKYAPYARDNFGQVPEAMDFFSRILGVDFPWNKYAEIVVRDYVGGAMENTTAAVFGHASTKRELADSYYNPGIEHELFHQWFGDYVTAESWSNITLNESFADLAELLWLEHKYGKDAADQHWLQGLQGYLDRREAAAKSLVSFRYGRPKEAFGVAYQKGGRILNMLRNYLGDAAFFRGLHIYLTRYAFQSAEVPQLRMALEEASGLDLNWFFNQWYYGAGHPELDISCKWDEGAGTQTVYLRQTQNGPTFILPMAIDIYAEGKMIRHPVWMLDKTDSFTFASASKPDLVNVDGDKILLAKKTENKPLDEYIFQYFHAPLYLDRYEALEAAAKNQDNPAAQSVLIAALTDKFSGLRLRAIGILNSNKEDIRNANPGLRAAALPLLTSLVGTDSNTLVRAEAINTLAILHDTANKELFIRALKSESYEVQGAALNGIGILDSAVALSYAKDLEKDNEGALTAAIIRVYAISGSDAQWPFVYQRYARVGFQDQVHLTARFAEMVGRLKDPADAQKGIEQLRQLGIQYQGSGAAPYMIKYINIIKERRAAANDPASATAAEKAIKEIEAAK